MIHDHHNRARGRGGIAVGVGAAATGMLIAVIGQLADAPIARADDFSTIVADIQAAELQGQADLGDAATAFEGGNSLQGLEDTFIGVDDSAIVPGYWVLLGGVDSVTGAALPGTTALDFDDIGAPPASYSDAVNEVTTFSAIGEQYLTDAASAFAANDPSDGVFDALGAVAILDVIDPELLALGLASSF
jgi:hypothetical protein